MAELTVLVPLGGRQIEMRKPSDGSLVVLARTFRGLPKIENVNELSDEQRDRVIRNLGTLGQVVEAMIVKDDDKDWLDDVMISGEVSAEDVFGVIAIAGEKFNGASTGPAKKAAAPVRRRR
jgi:precorrin-2 methylase